MNQNQQTLPKFNRRSQVGFNVMNFSEGETLFLKVTEVDVFEKRDGDKLDFASVVNLETGEEGRIWLDGQLKYNLGMLSTKNPFPFCIECEYLGKKPATVMIDGKEKETLVNSYKMWLIDEKTETDN